MVGHHHRSTLKQQNKPFKSKHSSKGSLKDAAKGRIQSVKVSTKPSSTSTRTDRRNAAKLAQKKKREELLQTTRVFGGKSGAPRIVAVVPLCPDVSARETVRALAESIDAEGPRADYGLFTLDAERFKQRLQFIMLPYRQLYAALDACKVADYVIFVLSDDKEVDEWGDTALRCLQAQGVPSAVTVVQTLVSTEAKRRPDVKKSLLSFIRYFLPDQEKVHSMDQSAEASNVLRSLCTSVPRHLAWRATRSWVLAEEVDWQESEGTQDKGVLKVMGTVRGAPMSASRLVHLQNFGDFALEKVTSYPTMDRRKLKAAGDTGMEVEPEVVVLEDRNEEEADDLVSQNDPDPLANEQTWPTEEEMAGTGGAMDQSAALPDAKFGTTPRIVKRVPKGTSAYQARWILDESDNEDEGSEDESESDEGEMQDDGAADQQSDAGLSAEDGEEEEEMEEIEISGRKTEEFMDLDPEEEEQQYKAYLEKRRKEDAEDAEFPDEVTTPMEIPALTRFQRYRGLKSFRTSPWDPYEDLPIDYSRIFQFEDYSRARRRVEGHALTVGIQPGTKVVLYIRDVPREAAEEYSPDLPFVVFGLLQHEHKKSVLNFTVGRNTEYDGTVKSKDDLVLCLGPRRLRVNPIFSQHDRGGAKGVNNVHKFERFLRHGTTSVATIFGPITFGKAPCLLLRETEDAQAPNLVAMGSFMDADPTRINAKRIILTGHPFKVHKKVATIRYMFFNPEDVNYFKPIQLYTKYGRTGHIRESLGTHGYFKAHFDGRITQMDTILLNLYKRVYPKWSETWAGTRHQARWLQEEGKLVNGDRMELSAEI